MPSGGVPGPDHETVRGTDRCRPRIVEPATARKGGDRLGRSCLIREPADGGDRGEGGGQNAGDSTLHVSLPFLVGCVKPTIAQRRECRNTHNGVELTPVPARRPAERCATSPFLVLRTSRRSPMTRWRSCETRPCLLSNQLTDTCPPTSSFSSAIASWCSGLTPSNNCFPNPKATRSHLASERIVRASMMQCSPFVPHDGSPRS